MYYDSLTGIQFPDGTLQSTAAPPGIASGSLTNVGNSRMVNTNYYNDKTWPLQVYFQTSGYDDATCTAYVDANSTPTTQAARYATGRYSVTTTFMIIVPPGYYYRIEAPSVSRWYENR